MVVEESAVAVMVMALLVGAMAVAAPEVALPVEAATARERTAGGSKAAPLVGLQAAPTGAGAAGVDALAEAALVVEKPAVALMVVAE